MFIRKKRIRNVAKHLATIPGKSEFRPCVKITPANSKVLQRIGFNTTPRHGDTVLPNTKGPISRFNADGRWEVHRDQPKEPRYIRTVSWRWKQWTGGGGTEEREEFRDIFRDCYPRTRLSPPGTELTYFEKDGEAYVIAPISKNTAKEHEAIRHNVNLLLEFFRECELVQADLSRFSTIKMTRLNWKMLPPGAHPWTRIYRHLKTVLKRTSKNTQTVIMDRQQTILAHEPAEQYIGQGGFSDYIAYAFPDAGLVVLECIRRDNAIYVFGKDWQRFAQLTKAEIIQNRHHMARIVHTNGWKNKLARLLDQPKAA